MSKKISMKLQIFAEPPQPPEQNPANPPQAPEGQSSRLLIMTNWRI